MTIKSTALIGWALLCGLIMAGCGSDSVQNPAPAGAVPTPAGSLAVNPPSTAESPAEQESTGFSLTDALGREVAFPAPPERIVVTGRGVFMIADALYLFPGAAERVAALADTAQGPGNFIELIDPAYAGKAVLDREAGPEQIAPLRPDAVILKSALAKGLGASIEALGVPVVYVEFETPEQYSRDLHILGRLLQAEERADRLVELYQARVQGVQNALVGLEDAQKPRALLLYANESEGVTAFNVPPLSWIQAQMVTLAGGVPVWAEASLGSGWTTVSIEQIAAWDPDKIFVIAYFADSGSVVEQLRADPNWALLRAVQTGELYAFPADQYSWDQPDPRWVLGLQWLAGRMHPDRFPGQDMIAEARSFYRDFYGLDDAFFDANIRPALKGDVP